MRIYDSIRGHFALLVKRQLKTLSTGAPFVITRVVSMNQRQKDWIVTIKPMSGKKPSSIYISDILRVYTWMVGENNFEWTSLKEIQQLVEKSQINLAQAPYIMALIETFDDVESRAGEDAAIRVMQHREKFGDPV